MEKKKFNNVDPSFMLLQIDKCISLTISHQYTKYVGDYLPKKQFKTLRAANGDVICQFSNSGMRTLQRVDFLQILPLIYSDFNKYFSFLDTLNIPQHGKAIFDTQASL